MSTPEGRGRWCEHAYGEITGAEGHAPVIYSRAMQPSPSPRIPANELRPGRHWYATAAGITVALLVLGVAIGAYRFHKVIDAVDTGSQFADGETVTLRLGPDHEKTLWIRDRGPSPLQTCSITGPGDPALADPGIDVYLTRDETWNPLYTLDVQRAGDYEVTCTSQRGPSRYAVGDSGGLVALGGWLVLAAVLPLLGLGIGVALTLVTAFRRRSHRRRLLAERAGRT